RAGRTAAPPAGSVRPRRRRAAKRVGSRPRRRRRPEGHASARRFQHRRERRRRGRADRCARARTCHPALPRRRGRSTRRRALGAAGQGEVLAMTLPVAFELQFLDKLQRLLAEGEYVATYKFAVLLALAELCVELPHLSGQSHSFTTHQLAERMLAQYWPHIRPIATAATAGDMLRQNSGKTAKILV